MGSLASGFGHAGLVMKLSATHHDTKQSVL
jgi:hypothetical protein